MALSRHSAAVAGIGLSIAITALASPAAAQNCTGLVERFAAEHGLTEAPSTAKPENPATEPRSQNMTDKLARSNGVIEPPQTGRTPVMPPASPNDRMPTTPSLDGDRRQDQAETPSKESARNAQASSLLDAARNAAQRGDEQDCMAKLEQAQQQLSEAR